ncbi:MAG: hypothetical protein Q9204_008479, partial [Flavoplaca sp. TL-2023a]
MSSDTDPSPSIILIMGKTGVGKSTFIKAATGLDVLTGHHLDSCTALPQFYPIPDTLTFLLDTPGFDDPSLSDTAVLQSIASCLADIFEGHVFPDLAAKISGIIYIQAINEPRMTGSMLQNLKMLRLLIGEGNMEHCMLVTTKWGLERLDVAERREAELIQTSEYWGGLLAQGAEIARYGDSQESALEITRAAARSGEFIPQLMQEYAIDGNELCATAAGRAIDGDVSRARERNEQELEKLRGEYKRAMDDENAESTAALNAVWIRIEESLRVIDEETQELRATRLEAQKQLDELEETAARTQR